MLVAQNILQQKRLVHEAYVEHPGSPTPGLLQPALGPWRRPGTPEPRENTERFHKEYSRSEPNALLAKIGPFEDELYTEENREI